jgi:hypothetical protein
MIKVGFQRWIEADVKDVSDRNNDRSAGDVRHDVRHPVIVTPTQSFEFNLQELSMRMFRWRA